MFFIHVDAVHIVLRVGNDVVGIMGRSARGMSNLCPLVGLDIHLVCHSHFSAFVSIDPDEAVDRFTPRIKHCQAGIIGRTINIPVREKERFHLLCIWIKPHHNSLMHPGCVDHSVVVKVEGVTAKGITGLLNRYIELSCFACLGIHFPYIRRDEIVVPDIPIGTQHSVMRCGVRTR